MEEVAEKGEEPNHGPGPISELFVQFFFNLQCIWVSQQVSVVLWCTPEPQRGFTVAAVGAEEMIHET